MAEHGFTASCWGNPYPGTYQYIKIKSQNLILKLDGLEVTMVGRANIIRLDEPDSINQVIALIQKTINSE